MGPIQSESADNVATRFLQIFFICEFAMFVGLLQQLFLAPGSQIYSLLGAMLLLVPAYFLIRKGKASLGGGYLLLAMLGIIFFLATNATGLHDEVLMAVPAVIIFSILIGDIRVFLLVSAIATGYVLMLGILVEEDVLTFAAQENTLESALTIAIVFVFVSLSAWLVDRDLRRVYARLALENWRVQRKNEQIKNLIFYDTLTGLPNRALAHDRCGHAIEQAKRTGESMAILFVDLDDFKAVNDNFGHKAGDFFLQEVGRCLKASVRAEDTVCRLGGDEFLIMLERVKEKEEITLVAEKILESVTRPVLVEGVEHKGSCSIGIATYPGDGENFDALCNSADQAMYKSKDIGKNQYSYFDQEVDRSARDRLSMLADLRFCIERNQLEVYYQPQIRVADGAIVGAEALLRWHHPERGLIAPNQFIPLAEKGGMIHQLGDWVLNKVATQSETWQRELSSDFRIAVNVSPLQLEKGDFAGRLADIFDGRDKIGRSLEIEFTESFIMKDADRFSLTINELRLKEIGLAIDDFGTGYSNLGYINRFDVGTLKIDQTFIRNLDTDDRNRVVVEAIVNLARALKMETVAEGVETESIYQALRSIGCDFAQGYFWARPMPAEDFTAYYRQEEADRQGKALAERM